MTTVLGIYALKYILKDYTQFSGSQTFFSKTDIETLISNPFTIEFLFFYEIIFFIFYLSLKVSQGSL